MWLLERPLYWIWERGGNVLAPERNSKIWWLGRSPNHQIYGSLLRARRLHTTLLAFLRIGRVRCADLHC